jgi:hypothetical protein
LRDVSLLRGVIFSEILGVKWMLTNRFGGNYIPLTDLMRWSERSI